MASIQHRGMFDEQEFQANGLIVLRAFAITDGPLAGVVRAIHTIPRPGLFLVLTYGVLMAFSFGLLMLLSCARNVRLLFSLLKMASHLTLCHPQVLTNLTENERACWRRPAYRYLNIDGKRANPFFRGMSASLIEVGFLA